MSSSEPQRRNVSLFSSLAALHWPSIQHVVLSGRKYWESPKISINAGKTREQQGESYSRRLSLNVVTAFRPWTHEPRVVVRASFGQFLL